MPFFETTTISTIIDYSKCQPISVIAAFNREGKIMPVYISLTDLYGNICKVKIDGVTFTKDGSGFTTYCCLYTTGRSRKQVNLTYFFNQHLWVLEN